MTNLANELVYEQFFQMHLVPLQQIEFDHGCSFAFLFSGVFLSDVNGMNYCLLLLY